MKVFIAPTRRRLIVGAGFVVALAVLVESAVRQAPPLERLTVSSDGHAMAVWARRPASPRGAILLVHGRTWSSRPDFDLQVPGLQRSVMVSLSQLGFAAYAVDLRGYGETKRDQTGWLTPRRAAGDVVNVATWVFAQHQNLPRPALVGWSRGAAVSMLAAQTAAPRFSGLVLFGFAFDPDQQFADPEYPVRPLMAKNTAAAAASDFISPKVTPKAVVSAFVSQALQADPITADLKNDGEYNVLDPARITMPTLVLYGERDINVTETDGPKFFERFGATNKKMVKLPEADHAAQLEDSHDAWIAAIVGFLTPYATRR